MTTLAKVDNWIEEVLVDPLSKSGLRKEGDSLVSDYGRKYPIRKGIYDLRLLTTALDTAQQLWEEGQHHYKEFTEKKMSREDCEKEKNSVIDVYADLPIRGRCIDIGGASGLLRAFIKNGDPYISVDPDLDTLTGIGKDPSAFQVYPFLSDPFNFICAYAEHLPFKSETFDTAHIRSCIDHMYKPELALREAHRVLRKGGQVIVGLFVEGGKTGRIKLTRKLKMQLKHVLSVFVGEFADHHIWHPTYQELCSLIESAGFKIDKTHWQKGYNDTVCYIRALKS